MPQRVPNGLPLESVWDYPRPPNVVASERRARIEHGGEVIGDSRRAVRVLETASPPAVYLPASDLRTDLLREVEGKTSICEWKGTASYFDLVLGEAVVESIAWTYPVPNPSYAHLREYFAFFPGRVDACFLDSERVAAQEGDYYGGWITAEVTGPFKGGPGTQGW